MIEARDRERARSFLRKGDAACLPAADGNAVLLDAGERGRIAVNRNTLTSMVQSGELAVRGGRLSVVEAPRGDGLGAAPRDMGVAAIILPEGRREVAINVNESPLAQLHRRRAGGGAPFLNEEEYQAGERLRADYERASIMPRLGANWEASVAGRKRSSQAGSMVELTDAVLAARQRVERAIKGVGPELSGVLIDVCCFLKGMETVEAERRWPARSAKLLLKAALGALARHYEPAGARRMATLHWGAEDYRPRIG